MSFSVLIEGACKATHWHAVEPKKPFADIPLEMRELDGGSSAPAARAFHGQLGLIHFNRSLRLPRHIHLGAPGPDGARALLPERILVLNGIALVELNGAIVVIAPETLVDIEPGVPHTWAVCPAGVCLPDGMVADGTFLMMYNYAEPTTFAPTASTAPITDAASFRAYDGDIGAIQFPMLDAATIIEKPLVWGRDLVRGALTLA